MEQKTARRTLPHNQSLTSSMNKCLLNVGTTMGTVALFAHPIDGKFATGRDENNLQFLGNDSGRTTNIGNEWSDDQIRHFVENLPGKKKGNGGNVKEALWMKANGCIRVNFGFAGIDDLDSCSQGINDERETVSSGGPFSKGSLVVNCDSNHCEQVQDNDASTGSNTTEQKKEPSDIRQHEETTTDWRTGVIDLDGHFSKAQLGYTHQNPEKDEYTKILEMGDSEYLASNFIESGRVGYLFQDQGEDDIMPLPKQDKMHITSQSMFSFLARVSVGASFRFLRRHICGEPSNRKAGYLPDCDATYSELGKVVQRCPLP